MYGSLSFVENNICGEDGITEQRFYSCTAAVPFVGHRGPGGSGVLIDQHKVAVRVTENRVGVSRLAWVVPAGGSAPSPREPGLGTAPKLSPFQPLAQALETPLDRGQSRKRISPLSPEEPGIRLPGPPLLSKITPDYLSNLTLYQALYKY